MKEEPYDFENWTTAELFNYLIMLGIIPDDEDFEDWKYDRIDMLKMCKNENNS